MASNRRARSHSGELRGSAAHVAFSARVAHWPIFRHKCLSLAELRRYYHGDTMDPMKVAISVPDKVFKAGERLAREQGISRSELYANALSAYLGVHGAAAITARLDAVYSKEDSRLDPGLALAQQQILTDEAW